jgi:hypothetical protein
MQYDTKKKKDKKKKSALLGPAVVSDMSDIPRQSVVDVCWLVWWFTKSGATRRDSRVTTSRASRDARPEGHNFSAESR